MEFIVGNYAIFIIIAIVLLLGLFGYMMDKKKYDKYREEIINEERIADAIEAAPSVAIDPNIQAQIAQQTQQVMPQAPMQPMQPQQPVQAMPVQPGQVVQPMQPVQQVNPQGPGTM